MVCQPPGFEQLCQRILREAGFSQVTVTGRSGDQGIDGYGTLQVNRLVLSGFFFNATGAEIRYRLPKFGIFAARWLDARTSES
jgi:hypothetical protein